MASHQGFRTKLTSTGLSVSNLRSADELLMAFNDLRKRGELYDVTLKTPEGSVNAHKLILAARCEYFNAMFTGGMSESRSSEVELPAIEYDCLNTLVNYFYSGKLHVKDDQMLTMISLTDMLQLIQLKDILLSQLLKNINSANCLGLHSFAESMGCGALKNVCTSVIQQGFPNVIHSKEFVEMPLKMLCQVLSHQDINLENEKEQLIVRAALLWLDRNTQVKDSDCDEDLPDKQAVVNQVLGCVRWENITENHMETLEKHIKEVRPDLWKEVMLLREKMKACGNVLFQRNSSFTDAIYAIGGFLQSRTGPSCPRLKTVEMYKVIDEKWGMSEALPFDPSFIYAFSIRGCIYCITTQQVADSSRMNTTKSHHQLLRYRGDWNVVTNCISPAVQDVFFELLNQEAILYYSLHFNAIFTVSMHGIHKMSICHDEEADMIRIAECERLVHKLPIQEKLVSFSVACCEGLLYIIGGAWKLSESEILPVSDLWAFNVNRKEWMKKASMTSPRSSAASVVMGGLIYVMGGVHIRRLKTVERYDPVVDSWTEISSMTQERAQMGAAAVRDKIYVMGGKSYSHGKGGARKVLRTCEMYNPDEPEQGWQSITAMEQARCMFGVA